ncbi:hypothetical protein M434DRAFT_296612 [Hypoxylon sp. CO27-5]|nr:hypothetical protein M434DRAFT_296612 [Hypoxylon sp. CO27-5]
MNSEQCGGGDSAGVDMTPTPKFYLSQYLHMPTRCCIAYMYSMRNSVTKSPRKKILGVPKPLLHLERVGIGGEGDSAGGPIPERRGHDKWPTLVIEAGVNESLAQLRLDTEWWFAASNHDVKIVLLAKLDSSQRMITLEKWVEEPVAARSGATTTRRSAALRPILQQTITIRRNEATSPISYNVTRGALVLEFRLLFLQSPGSGEGDIIISVSDLQWYAECVWD